MWPGWMLNSLSAQLSYLPEQNTLMKVQGRYGLVERKNSLERTEWAVTHLWLYKGTLILSYVNNNVMNIFLFYN